MRRMGGYHQNILHEWSKRTSRGGLAFAPRPRGHPRYVRTCHVKVKKIHDATTITHLSTHHDASRTVCNSCPYARTRPERPSAQPKLTLLPHKPPGDPVPSSHALRCTLPHTPPWPARLSRRDPPHSRLQQPRDVAAAPPSPQPSLAPAALAQASTLSPSAAPPPTKADGQHHSSAASPARCGAVDSASIIACTWRHPLNGTLRRELCEQGRHA